MLKFMLKKQHLNFMEGWETDSTEMEVEQNSHSVLDTMLGKDAGNFEAFCANAELFD